LRFAIFFRNLFSRNFFQATEKNSRIARTSKESRHKVRAVSRISMSSIKVMIGVVKNWAVKLAHRRRFFTARRFG